MAKAKAMRVSPQRRCAPLVEMTQVWGEGQVELCRFDRQAGLQGGYLLWPRLAARHLVMIALWRRSWSSVGNS